jgi:hypothetical protein
MAQPKALTSLSQQEPCVVLSTTEDPVANYGAPPEHLILMVEERDEILAYIDSLVDALRELTEASESVAVYPEGSVGLDDLSAAETKARALLDQLDSEDTA